MTVTDHQRYAAAVGYDLLDRGSDHLVVLLHGLGGDRNQPLGLTTDRLAGTGVSVLAPDARAHGETEVIGGPDDFTTAALAADVLTLVDTLGLSGKQLIPVGISMGAAVGLQLVLQYPDRVAGAVLIRPSFEPEPWPAHARVFQTIAALLRRDGAAALPEFQQTEQYRQVRDESVSAATSLAEQFTKPHAAQRVVRLETVPGNTAVDWPGQRDPGVPLTIVGADRDPGHPLAVARLWHQRLAGSTLVEVPSRDREPQAYAAGLHRVVTDTVAGLTRTTTR
jgi:pimeloyl-ACP methyl ester carboxylesterase